LTVIYHFKNEEETWPSSVW